MEDIGVGQVWPTTAEPAANRERVQKARLARNFWIIRFSWLAARRQGHRAARSIGWMLKFLPKIVAFEGSSQL
jgi:hypothetical protein